MARASACIAILNCAHEPRQAKNDSMKIDAVDFYGEYPIEPRQLALDITSEHLLPDRPSLGLMPSLTGIAPYLVDLEIRVGGRTLYRTPTL